MKKLTIFLLFLCIFGIEVIAQCTQTQAVYADINNNFPAEGTTLTLNFEVWANEAYIMNICENGNYTVDFCNGYNPLTWPATITVGYTLDGATISSVITSTDDCTLNFNTPTAGQIILVISDTNDCGGVYNQTDNGILTFTNVIQGINCICETDPTWVDDINNVATTIPQFTCFTNGTLGIPYAVFGTDSLYLTSSSIGTPLTNTLADATIDYITFTEEEVDLINSTCGSSDSLLVIYFQGANNSDCFDSLLLDLSTNTTFSSITNINTFCNTSNFGCTDMTACNYDALATIDDESCTYGIAGCPDPCCQESCPFDPNTCAGAILLNIGNNVCNLTSIDNTSFGDSGENVDCGNFTGGDIWFSFKAPFSGNVQIEAFTNNFTNVVVNVLDGTCGNFTSLACNAATLFGETTETLITGLTPGATYYIQVYENNNNPGIINICAFEPVLGCTDPCFTEYNPIATGDDGSCLSGVPPTPCDDGIVCTTNDVIYLGVDGSICVPCMGTITPTDASLGDVCEDFEIIEPNLPDCWRNTNNPNGLGGQESFGWQTQTGFTNSGGTGPSTGNAGSLTYMYMEASGSGFNGSPVDSLFTPAYDLSNGGPYALEFYYHMLTSSTPATFEVLIESPANSGNFTSLFSITGSQGNLWQYLYLDLTAYTGSVNFVFVVNDNGGLSDVAIDDVCVKELILGCTDPCFVEYDPIATINDGCLTNVTNFIPCDDGNSCTVNDEELLGVDGSVCIPCTGTPIPQSLVGVTPLCEEFETITEPTLPGCWRTSSNGILGGQEGFGWQTQTGSPPNFTLPTTGNNGSSTYIYMNPTIAVPDTLFSPIYDLSTGVYALDFAYFLSNNFGTSNLNVYIESPANSGNLIFLFNGISNSAWNTVNFDLTSYTGLVNFVFIGQENFGVDNIALDDICLRELVSGCIDPCFVEYDPLAVADDGSCQTNVSNFVPCDDGRACTINDVILLGLDGSICIPCMGTPIPITVTGVTPLCENFEVQEPFLPECWYTSSNNGLGGQNSFGWQTQTGSTNSSSTGPSTGNAGSQTYIYMEASGGNGTDTLFSPTYDLATGGFVVNFYNHMLTSGTPATLEVFIEAPANSGNLTLLLSLTGDQGDNWLNEFLDVSTYTNLVNFVFVVDDNGGIADIAIDDFCIEEAVYGCNSPCFVEYNPTANADDGSCLTPLTNFTPCDDNNDCSINDVELIGLDGSICVPCMGTVVPTALNDTFPTCESFEVIEPNLPSCWLATSNNGLGEFGGFGWQTQTGSTTSNSTGPTDGNQGSQTYIYMEATGGDGTDTLFSPVYDLSNNPYTLDFFYHMLGPTINSGATPGVLEVFIESPINSGNLTLLFSISGNQGNDWNNTAIDLTGYTGLAQILFVVNDNSGFGDIALDDICFYRSDYCTFLNTCVEIQQVVLGNELFTDCFATPAETYTYTWTNLDTEEQFVFINQPYFTPPTLGTYSLNITNESGTLNTFSCESIVVDKFIDCKDCGK